MISFVKSLTVASFATRLKNSLTPLKWCTLVFFLFSVAIARADTNNVPSCTEEDFTNTVLMGGYIAFTQDCSITLTATVPIQQNTTIDTQGHNVTISGGNQVQLFSINAGSLSGIGLVFTAGSCTNGGAIYVNSGASLLLSNCAFVGNSALGTNGLVGSPGSSNNVNGVGGNGGNGTAGTSGVGGAIYNLGNVFLQNCSFTTNNATGGNGGAGGNGGTQVNQGGNGGVGAAGGLALGGAIYNGHNLTLTNCTFAGNTATAGSGGAGGTGGGGVFSGMDAAGGAGGNAGGAAIWNDANLTLTSSTFSGNKVQGGTSAAGGNQVNGVGTTGMSGGSASGGGVYSKVWGTIINCTFYNNNVTGGTGGNGGNGSGSLPQGGNGGNGGNGFGGGIDNAGTLGVTNCTIANCAAIGGTNGVAGSGRFPGSPGNPGAAAGGGIANTAGTFTLANSILATNLAGLNGYGTIVAGGYNLSSDLTPTSLSSASRNKDPLIGSLANNGGPTQTIALRSTNSPAYAQIPAGTAGLPTMDQRGVQRAVPGKNAADIGAFELATLPTISGQPQSQMQTNGGSVTFTVAAYGDSLKYLWRFNGTPTNVTTSSYTLNNVTVTNAGVYDVVVSNSYKTIISAPATLGIWPYIITQPTNFEVDVGGPATFVVGVTGTPPWQVQWMHYGTNLPGKTDATLTIPTVMTNDAGPYTVSIIPTNSSFTITSSVATLTVDAILVQPQSQTVASGSTVRLSVVASGNGLKYEWHFNNTNTISTAIGPSYSFIASKATAGTYDVAVYNSFASIPSTPAVITVLDPPTITNQPASQTISPGQNATFTVSATGDPPLIYQWNFQGAPISGATGTAYTVSNAQQSNSGSYSVTITNPVASITSTIARLVVLAQPLAITNASFGSNGFSFTFYGVSNLTYVVQYTNRLGSLSNWATGAAYPGSNSWIQYRDATTNQPQKYYRVKVQ